MTLNKPTNLKNTILPEGHPWQNLLSLYDCLPSTNDTLKALAHSGAPEGTAILADRQSAGRGRLGRSFHAPAKLGMYLSVLLRPACPPDQLMHLTCAAAVAVCDAVVQCTGVRPQIKWTNDLILEKRKVGGILTELSVNSRTGLVDWAIIGIGINCLHENGDFPPELRDMATSLRLSTGVPVDPHKLAMHTVAAVHNINRRLLSEKEAILAVYRHDCMTLNQPVVLHRADQVRYGTALDIDGQGGLIVAFDDGQTDAVQSGEISVRGLYGYVP